MITVLVDPAELTGEEEVIVVEGDTYRHLFRARRLAVGARLRLVDGEGTARWAEVVHVDRKTGRLRVGEPAPTHEAARRVELLVASLRRERASWLVEKATEIGVAAVRFLETEHTVRDLSDNAFARLHRVAAAALEQCHRSRLPEITGVHGWNEVPSLLEPLPDRRLLDADADGDDGSDFGGPAEIGRPAALLIGPEGGWTADERDRLLDLGARRVSLGPRVLRIETAALVGAGLLLCTGPAESR